MFSPSGIRIGYPRWFPNARPEATHGLLPKKIGPDERQPREGTKLLRLPQEDTCMALPRYLFGAEFISAEPPLDIGVLMLKHPEITRVQDLDPVVIELQ
jgi:hypothetical protein